MSNLLIGLFLGIILGLAAPPFYKWIVSKVTKKNEAGMALIFMLLTIGLASCGSTTGDPNIDTITFSQAWDHVTSFSSYWWWLAGSAVPLIGYIIYLVKYKNSQLSLPILFVCLAILAAGILYAPAECAANTTIEKASRGVFIR